MSFVLMVFHLRLEKPLVQLKAQCIIHQQVLCSKVLRFENVMSLLLSTVNFIHARGLTHALFRVFLEEVSANYSDLLCYAEVRWLSSGTVLQTFIAFRDLMVHF
jgi:hypothetical protein